MFAETITTQEIEKLPLTAFGGKIEVIDRTDRSFSNAIRYLSSKKLLGFDTESRPSFSSDEPRHGTALVQLSGAEKAFLFRVNTLGMHERLLAILGNPSIVKVGAAVLDDVRGLQRIKGFQPAGFVDLQKIVGSYGIKEKSVKKMSAIVLGVRISKNQQLSNWEAETLTEAQQLYAATDAWICREMYKKLLRCEKVEEDV